MLKSTDTRSDDDEDDELEAAIDMDAATPMPGVFDVENPKDMVGSHKYIACKSIPSRRSSPPLSVTAWRPLRDDAPGGHRGSSTDRQTPSS